MKKYDYYAIEVKFKDMSKLTDYLKGLGKKGWELISINYLSHFIADHQIVVYDDAKSSEISQIPESISKRKIFCKLVFKYEYEE